MRQKRKTRRRKARMGKEGKQTCERRGEKKGIQRTTRNRQGRRTRMMGKLKERKEGGRGIHKGRV